MAVYEKVTPKYVVDFRDAGMSRKLDKAVWARYTVDDTVFEAVLLVIVQRAFLQRFSSKRVSDVPEKMEDENDIWDVEGMVAANEVSTSDTCVRLRGM